MVFVYLNWMPNISQRNYWCMQSYRTVQLLTSINSLTANVFPLCSPSKLLRHVAMEQEYWSGVTNEISPRKTSTQCRLYKRKSIRFNGEAALPTTKLTLPLAYQSYSPKSLETSGKNFLPPVERELSLLSWPIRGALSAIDQNHPEGKSALLGRLNFPFPHQMGMSHKGDMFDSGQLVKKCPKRHCTAGIPHWRHVLFLFLKGSFEKLGQDRYLWFWK